MAWSQQFVVVVLLAASSSWSLAPPTARGGKKTRVAKGFGPPLSSSSSSAKKKEKAGAALLEESEEHYDSLSAYDGRGGSPVTQEFVIAVRCRTGGAAVSRQLTPLWDWLPVALAGVATELPSTEAVPRVVAARRLELAEATRLALSRTKQLSPSLLEFSYEPADKWEDRVVAALERRDAEKRTALDAARDLLGVAPSADVDALKKAYLRNIKERKAHPDQHVGDDAKRTHAETYDGPTVQQLKQARDLLVASKEAGLFYANIRGNTNSTFRSAFVGPLDLTETTKTKTKTTTKTRENAKKKKDPLLLRGDDGTIIHGAVTSLDPDIVQRFLYRNVRNFDHDLAAASTS